MTYLQIRRLLATADARELRIRCGISAATIARALGVTSGMVFHWETRRRYPTGPPAPRYARIIAALAEHDAITRQLEADGPL